MNDELVYALLALALYWGLGWRAGQKLRKHHTKWCGDAEISAMLGIFFGGVLFWAIASLYIRYQTRGSLFGKEK